MSLTLYYHPLSSFCHKALIALYENDVAFTKRYIDLGNAQERAELCALWPLGKFPVLRDAARDRVLAESSIIIEYLEHFSPGRRPLLPDDFDTLLEVRLWDRVFDNYVQAPLQQIVADHLQSAHGDLSRARATLNTAYHMIDAQLRERTWIASPDFSLADCAAMPALFYAHTVQPFPAQCERLGAYFERLLGRASVQRVLEEAKPYFSLYPFQSAIPQRFR